MKAATLTLFLAVSIISVLPIEARVPGPQVINEWLDIEDMRSPASVKTKKVFVKHYLYCGQKNEINSKIFDYYSNGRISFDSPDGEVFLGHLRGPAGHVIRDLKMTPVPQSGSKSICMLFSI